MQWYFIQQLTTYITVIPENYHGAENYPGSNDVKTGGAVTPHNRIHCSCTPCGSGAEKPAKLLVI